MKKLSILFLGLVTLLSTGCPVGLDYALGVPGSEKINPALIGTWHCERESPEVVRAKVEKGEQNSYKVTVLERGEMYALETDNLQGWITTLNNATFLYLKPEGEEKFYHYQFSLEGSKLTTNDVSLLDGGVDAITSTESLRDQVKKSMSHEEWASEPSTWTKE
jgi:hypothetical protein